MSVFTRLQISHLFILRDTRHSSNSHLIFNGKFKKYSVIEMCSAKLTTCLKVIPFAFEIALCFAHLAISSVRISTEALFSSNRQKKFYHANLKVNSIFVKITRTVNRHICTNKHSSIQCIFLQNSEKISDK